MAHAHSAEHTQDHSSSHGPSHGASHYVKIWGVLLALLIVSICGPMVGIRWLTLLTAFGIAIVKAYIVAAEFMHLKYEKKFITYMLLSMLFIMFIFFFGVAPDVMTPGGQNWIRPPIQEATHAPAHEAAGAEH